MSFPIFHVAVTAATAVKCCYRQSRIQQCTNYTSGQFLVSSIRQDIRALGRTGGTDLFDVTICHPLSQARIRDAVQNPLNILKAAWAGKVSRYAAMVHEAGRSVQLLPVPTSTLGGWHPDAHRALCAVATAIAGRATFSSAKSILF